MEKIPKKPQRQRKRVPIACLNCKKRKVKCDKVKPACGGCVRNGVKELCEYIEPTWASNSGMDIKNEDILTASNGFTQDHGKLQVQEQVIELQKKEIDDLRKQLDLIKNPSIGVIKNDRETDNEKMYILDKLNPSNSISSKTLNVSNDISQTVAPTKYINNEYIDIYSWINVIKLDPQLTKLWYHITNLQKAYHLFKKNISNMKLQSGMIIKSESPIDINSSTKKNDYKVNEIDFTYSFSPAGPRDETYKNKCPVIECDFNFMVDDKPKSNGGTPFVSKNTPIMIQSTPSSVSPSEPQFIPSSNESGETSQLKQCPFKHSPNNDLINSSISWNSVNKVKDIVFKLQNMWDSILCLSRGNDKLNYKQLYFLMDFYFNNTSFEIESRNLFKFYKFEIQKLVVKNGDAIMLNVYPFGGKDEEDPQTLVKLNSQGIYLSMLSLIIEESLDILRHVARIDSVSELTIQFQILFPAEIVFLSSGYKKNNILEIVQEFIIGIKDESSKIDRLKPSLSGITCSVALLNREMTNNKKQGSKSVTKSTFCNIFVFLMNTFLCEDSSLEIWKDPKLINFSNESQRRNTDLKIHFCYLWYNVIRLSNIVTFKFTSLIKHLGHHYTLIRKIYRRIGSSEMQGVHVNYLCGLKSDEFKKLVFDFKIQFLISRIYFTLNSGIMNPCDSKVSVTDIRAFIVKCNTALKDVDSTYNYKTKDIEITLILSYLSFFLSYSIYLQGEEINDERLTSEFLPEIFVRCYYFITKFEDIILSESSLIDCQYILLAVTELLSRFTQISVGLFLRFCNDELLIPKNQMIEELALKLNNGIPVDNVAKDRFIISKIEQTIERTLLRLTKSSLIDKEKSFRLLRLWGFYLTFVRSISKISSINYENIHANVPGFKTMTSNPSQCPIFIDSKGLKSNIEEFKKCPVFNGNSSMPNNEISISNNRYPISHTQMAQMSNNLAKCPINHSQLMSKTNDSTKCPLDHTLLKRTSSTLTPVEKNTKRQKSQHIYLPPIDFNRAPSPSVIYSSSKEIATSHNPQIDRMQQFQQLLPMDTTNVKKEDIPFDDIGLTSEFNDFDFDFDFLQNDYVMQQINDNVFMDPYLQ